jgi:hypoxanthine phosphoribosyltransferase
MIKILFTEIKNALDDFTLPSVDLVIGIAEGGLVPAALTANKLGCELKIIKINYRDENNTPKVESPQLIKTFDEHLDGKKILLVDDVCVSGKTMDTARNLFPGNEILTFVFKGKAEYVLLPNIKECVDWPWKY